MLSDKRYISGANMEWGNIVATLKKHEKKITGKLP
jgi:hypothetical protein